MNEYEERLVAAVTRVESMGADIASIKGTMERVADAITRLAVVEERQVQTHGAIQRAFNELDKLDVRVRSLEDAQPLQKQTSQWVHMLVQTIVTTVAAAVIGLVVVKNTEPPKAPPTVIAPR